MDGMFPKDWYWLADDGRLYGSARQVLVDSGDADYVAWLDGGRKPTQWPADDSGEQTDKSLLEVIGPYGLMLAADALDALRQMKARLKVDVDQIAEAVRQKFITPGAGQAMTYQQKMEEVRALAQDSEPAAANYPLLASEIGITAPTLAEVASIVLAAYQQWQVIGAAIERVRLGTKAAIDAATSRQDAQAVMASAEWPNP